MEGIAAVIVETTIPRASTVRHPYSLSHMLRLPVKLVDILRKLTMVASRINTLLVKSMRHLILHTVLSLRTLQTSDIFPSINSSSHTMRRVSRLPANRHCTSRATYLQARGQMMILFE